MAKARTRTSSRNKVVGTRDDVAQKLVSDIAAALAEYHDSLRPPRLPRRWSEVHLRRFRAPERTDIAIDESA